MRQILTFALREDETLRLDFQWCPSCGFNAKIITWETKIGTKYRCGYCGVMGRFGDGFSEPQKDQPDFEEK